MSGTLTTNSGHLLSVPEPAAKVLAARITEYLCAGGLFNPELAEHDNVRDLLIDVREHLTHD